MNVMENADNGIEQLLTGPEAKELGADAHCAFILEARKGYHFLESIEGDFIKHINAGNLKSDKKYTLTTHGYSPQKPDYTTVFMAAGKRIRKGKSSLRCA